MDLAPFSQTATEISLTGTDPAIADSKRPRFFFGWYIVLASVVTNTIFSAAYFQGFSAFILPIESHFGWSRTTIGAAMGLRQLESGIVSPFIGVLLDKFSPRRIIFISAIVAGIGFIGLGLMTGITTFYIFFIIISLGASGTSHAVTWPVVIARWFRRKRGLAIGIGVMGPIFGSPFVIVNTQLETIIGWRALLIGYGVIVLLVVTVLASIARDRPENYGLRPDGDPPEEGEEPFVPGAPRRPDTGMTVRQVVRTKEFWLLTAYLSGMFTVNSGFQTHMVPYFVQDLGLSPTGAAVTLTLVFFLSGFGRIGGGSMMDRFDYRLILAVVAVMMGVAFVYLQVGNVTSVLRTLPFVALFGLSFGSIIPIRGALGSLMFGTRSIGAVVGLLQGGAVAAGVVGPVFMAIIFDVYGNYSISIWALVAVCMVMVPLALAMSSPAVLKQRLASANP